MSDLRELFETAKGDAPPPRFGVDDIVAAGRRRRRRQLPLRAGGGVAAVAVLTAAVLVGNYLLLSPARPAATVPVAAVPAAPVVAAPPFAFMVGPYTAGGYRVLPADEVTLTYQSATIAVDHPDQTGKTVAAYVGTLTLYRPGVRPPAEFTSGTAVTVNGLPGFADQRQQDARLVANGSGVFDGVPSIMANTLAWQYQSNSWAVINSVIGDPAEAALRLTADAERALAEKFTLGTAVRARIPFTAGYLPAGWKPASVTGRGFTAENAAQVTVVFAPPAATTADRIRHFADAGDGTGVAISITHKGTRPPDAPTTRTACGPLDSATDLWCSWDIPHTAYVMVVHDPASRLSADELTRIAQGLVFDNLDQPDTWHPVP